MRSIYDFIISPKESRYTNSKKVGGKTLIVNTEIYNHQYVSRNAIIKSTPMIVDTNIRVGDEVIVHHNVFRRWLDIKGIERNSKSYIDENNYCVKQDQIFSYKRNNKWLPVEGYCFVKPVKNKDTYSNQQEEELVGVIKQVDTKLKDFGIKENDLVGFIPNSEYEFVIDGERLYRVLSNHISIKYEYQGNKEEYNPSWANSS
tara:strand:+ start:1877 stop:2482 length:606 start_codon:yes stop_codon:yes gene_type:complete